MRRDSIGEELRILYVAMTRAQEKLILTATDDKIDATLSDIARLPLREERLLSLQDREGYRSYYSFLMAALADHPAMQAFMKERGALPLGDAYQERDAWMQTDVLIRHYDAADLTLADAAGAMAALLRKEQLLGGEAEIALSADAAKVLAEVRTRMTTPYPHPDLEGLFTKTTVTELKQALLEESESAGNGALNLFSIDDVGSSSGDKQNRPHCHL